MNNPTPDSPRLFCRVVRAWTSLAGGPASAGNRLGSRHVANCAACRAHFEAAAALETGLRRDAAGEFRSVSPDFAGAVAAAIRRPRRPERVPVVSRPAVWTAALCTVAAAVALALFVGRSPQPAKTAAAADPRPADVRSIATAVVELPRQLRAAVVPAATRLAGENPLFQEVADVQTDARSALGFLASSFAPSKSLDVLIPFRTANPTQET